MPPKTNEEICEHCRIPQGLCNLLQDIVYDDNTSKRAEMARQFRMDIGMFLTEKDKEREEAVKAEREKILGVECHSSTGTYYRGVQEL